MDLKRLIRHLKTSPWLAPALAAIDLVLWAVDGLAALTTPHRPRPNTLLILRLDVLGDYLLFRNYLRVLRESAQYRNYTITLCGNAAIRSVAEPFDGGVIDHFIWTDIYALSTRPAYRFRFVRHLRAQGFTSVFCPTYSRVLVLDDFLAFASGAAVRVGTATDFVNMKRWEAWLGNRLYTRLLPAQPGIVFEGERNRQIVAGFLGETVAAAPLLFDLARAAPINVPDPCVVLSLGAGQDFRVWPADRFAAVARHIRAHYPAHQLVVTGAPNERVYADAFLSELADKEHIIDLTGKLSLSQLIFLLSKASLLIANETGTVHLAAATQTPTIVLSQGKTLIRWHPYPTQLAPNIRHLYPPELEAQRDRFAQIAPQFNPESPYPITTISVARVVAAVDTYLDRPVLGH